MIEITDELRDAIDNQIRERTLRERGSSVSLVTAMVGARTRLKLGPDLQYACPYMRDCKFLSIDNCIKNPYRKCEHYKLCFQEDVLGGTINLEGCMAG